MKKVYTAPLFQAEMFTAAQSTNRACSEKVALEDLTLQSTQNCAWNFGGIMLFTLGNNACTEDGNLTPLGCYHNLTSDATAFHS